MTIRFRTLLAASTLSVALLAAIPSLVAEARSPWTELAARVHTAEGVLATAMIAVPPADREAMARFTRARLTLDEVDAAGFVGQIAPGAGAAPPAAPEWAAALAADPAAAAAVARAWPILSAAREASRRAGLDVDDV